MSRLRALRLKVIISKHTARVRPYLYTTISKLSLLCALRVYHVMRCVVCVCGFVVVVYDYVCGDAFARLQQTRARAGQKCLTTKTRSMA